MGTKMKLPVQTTLEPMVLARAASIFETNGIRIRSKSDLLEQIVSYFISSNPGKGIAFQDNVRALDYLASLRIGISALNSRQRKAMDKFTIENPSFCGLVMPDNFEITSKDKVLENAARDEIMRNKANFDRLYEQANQRSSECPLDQPIQFTQKEQSSLQELHRGIMEEISKKETTE